MNNLFLGRDEATRTPDPYVPNVVRYQLRYIPIPNTSRYLPKTSPCKWASLFKCAAKVLQKSEIQANEEK